MNGTSAGSAQTVVEAVGKPVVVPKTCVPCAPHLVRRPRDLVRDALGLANAGGAVVRGLRLPGEGNDLDVALQRLRLQRHLVRHLGVLAGGVGRLLRGRNGRVTLRDLGQVGLAHDRLSRRAHELEAFLLRVVGIDDRHVLGLPVEGPVLDVPATDHRDARRVERVDVVDPVGEILAVSAGLVGGVGVGYFGHVYPSRLRSSSNALAASRTLPERWRRRSARARPLGAALDEMAPGLKAPCCLTGFGFAAIIAS